MDRIILNGMRFFGYHGVLPEENVLGQRFIVDIELYLNLAAAGEQDDLQLTVNYVEVYDVVRGILEGSPLSLLEAVAERVASVLLRNYTNVYEISVRITKPHPPFAVDFDGVAIQIHRKRD